MKKITIDCDKQPKILYDGWKIEEHKKMGKLVWDPENIELYLSENQKTEWIHGNELRKELEDKPVLNACVLDYLLEHQNLIPDSWKGKYVFFWGTIYRNSYGRLCVRCLYWGDGEWRWSDGWLGSGWSVNNPAALRASIGTKSLDSSALALKPLELRISALETKLEKIGEILKA